MMLGGIAGMRANWGRRMHPDRGVTHEAVKGILAAVESNDSTGDVCEEC